MRLKLSFLLYILPLLFILFHAVTLIFGKWVWWLDIFTHFQAQFAVGGILLTGILWLRTRHIYYTLCTGLYSACIALWVASTLTLAPTPEFEEADIYFQNVLFRQSPSTHQEMARTILETPARVYAFVEPHPNFIATIANTLGKDPIVYHAQGGSSCAVFSSDDSLQVRDAYVIYERSSFDPICVVHFETFDLFVAHPLPPLNKVHFERQNVYFSELQELIRTAESQQRAWVVVGDFNATLYSARMRNAFPQLQKQHYTWRTPLPFALPIDHAFSSMGLGIQTQPRHTSDHAGLRIQFIQ